jgi:hypothetical protein
MAAVFLYRCPNTGLNVQGRIESEPTDRETDLYEAVTCTACAGVHLVNPKTGRLFGEEDATSTRSHRPDVRRARLI